MKQKGFTLIEILVATGIALLLTGGVVVNFVGFQDKQKVQQASADLKNAFRYVQSKAVSGEKPAGCTSLTGYTVSFTASSYTASATCSPAITPTPMATKTLPADVTFSPLPSSVVFLPLGDGVSQEQMIVLSGKTVSFSVNVTKSGTVSDAVVPTPTPTGTVGPTNGLVGSYYDNKDFTSFRSSRTDLTVNFDWDDGRPISNVDPDSFSIKWDGFLVPKTTGSYKFFIESNDGGRIYLNDVKIANRWDSNYGGIGGGEDGSANQTLTAGQKYKLRVEMYEASGKAKAILRWTGPGLSKQPIDWKYLFTQ